MVVLNVQQIAVASRVSDHILSPIFYTTFFLPEAERNLPAFTYSLTPPLGDTLLLKAPFVPPCPDLTLSQKPR